MTGTKAGGAKAAASNKARHGADYYAKIGSKGGKNGHTGGFFNNPELARIAGKKGGQVSKRRRRQVSDDYVAPKAAAEVNIEKEFADA